MSSWVTKESGNILFTFDQLVLPRIFNLNTKKKKTKKRKYTDLENLLLI